MGKIFGKKKKVHVRVSPRQKVRVTATRPRLPGPGELIGELAGRWRLLFLGESFAKVIREGSFPNPSLGIRVYGEP